MRSVLTGTGVADGDALDTENPVLPKAGRQVYRRASSVTRGRATSTTAVCRASRKPAIRGPPVAAAIGGMVVPQPSTGRSFLPGEWSRGWGAPRSDGYGLRRRAHRDDGATRAGRAVHLLHRRGHRRWASARFAWWRFSIQARCTPRISAGRGAGRWRAQRSSTRAHLPRRPYLGLGIVLWFFVHEGGLHATLTGVVLALFIPTRPPPNLNALMTQANTISRSRGGARRRGSAARAFEYRPARAGRDSRSARIFRRIGCCGRLRPVRA